MESSEREFVYDPGHLPPRDRIGLWLCRLLWLPWAAKPIGYLIKRRLGIPQGSSIEPGFRYIVGRLKLKGPCALCDTFFVDYAPVELGENVAFSFQNMVLTSTHNPLNFQQVVARPVVIEDNVWVTSRVIILGGVRIGRNSIIGAGSVVTYDIPPNVFAAGNPCRVVKEIRRNG